MLNQTDSKEYSNAYAVLSPISDRQGLNQWTEQDKRRAVISLLIYGNQAEVARVTGIPATTLSYWRSCEWFDSFTADAMQHVGHEIRAGLTAIVGKTVQNAIDRLDNGDIKTHVIRTEDEAGNVTSTVQTCRVPATLKDISYAGAMFIDRWLLLQGKATRITHTEGADRYATLAKALAGKAERVLEHDEGKPDA